jgi:hypothetical protein
MNGNNEKEYEIGGCKITLEGCHINIEEISGKKFLFLSILNNQKNDGGFMLKVSQGEFSDE